MLKLLLSILACTPLFTNAQNSKLSISLHLKNMPDGIMFYLNDKKQNVDSSISKDEKITFSYKKSNETVNGLMVVSKDKKNYYLVWLENKPMRLSGTFGDISPISGKGSQTQKDFVEYRKLSVPLEDSITDFSKQPDTTTYAKSAINGHLTVIKRDFILTHPTSAISTYLLLLESTKTNFTKDELLSLYNHLDKTQQQSDYGKAISDSITSFQQPQIGQPAPDFTMTDLFGNKISLSDFKGKGVFLMFGASWCGPCKKDLPKIKSVFAKSDRRRFQFIGIYLEENRANWEKYIKDESIPWLNISDLKGGISETYLKYGANGVPDYFLIDVDGNLVAHTRDFKSLEKTLLAE